MPFNWLKKFQVFRQKVKTQNKCKVGNLEENIKQIEKKIDVVKGNLMADPRNVILQRNNVYLSQKLNQVLKLEEIKWSQKARQTWT